MSEYNLEPGEFVILQEDNASLANDKDDLAEVVLTNRNLILVADVSTGLFQTKRYLKRCPLEALCDYEGAPQVMATKQRGKYVLQLGFESEAISLVLRNGDKDVAQKWSQAARAAAVGDLATLQNGLDKEDGLAQRSKSSDSADLAGLASEAGWAAGNLFGWKAGAGVALAGSVAGLATKGISALSDLAQANKPEQPAQPAKTHRTPPTTKQCRGCHATLQGRPGQTVTCPYCDTKQTI